MRKIRQLLGLILSLLLVTSLSMPVKAAQLPGTPGADSYPDTYTFRIFTGQQSVMLERTGDTSLGRLSEDGKMFVIDGLQYGQRMNFRFEEISVVDPTPGGSVSGGDVSGGDVSGGDALDEQYNYYRLIIEEFEKANPDATQPTPKRQCEILFRIESKYYIIGTRESGKDNDSAEAKWASVPVEHDADYVAGYALLKDSVEYTVRYVNSAGVTLRDDDKYRGTIGDKPVVSYRYFDGYQPQAYNLTKTLVADASENIFTFVYSPVPAPGVTVTTIPGPPGPEGQPGEDTIITVPGGGGGGAAVPPAVDDGGGELPGGGGGGQFETIPEPDTPTGAPADLEDLDEPEVPLSGFDAANAFLVSIPLPAKILAVAVLVVLLGGVIWWILKCRKKRKDDVEDEMDAKGSPKSKKHPKEKS